MKEGNYMEKHHQESIDNFVNDYKNVTSVLAILLGGSLAHGFAMKNSDIDLLIIVDKESYEYRKKENKLTFCNFSHCTYEDGYIDCKCIDYNFLKLVAQKGSDAARYAFKDAKILFSRRDDLSEILRDIERYPLSKKEDRIKRFAAQLLAWKWYYSEAVKKQNTYLMYLAIQKSVLFGTRLILTINELLYPYHKWMLRVLEKAQNKPDNIIERINDLYANHSIEKVNSFCDDLFSFANLDQNDFDWGNYFLKDNELNWIEHEPPIDDL